MNVQINYFQSNNLNNSLNLKVCNYTGFNNIMIDFGINIINKAYSLFDNYDDRVKYISDSFNSTFPDKSRIGKKWNCCIFLGGGYHIYSNSIITYSTKKEYVIIFKT